MLTDQNNKTTSDENRGLRYVVSIMRLFFYCLIFLYTIHTYVNICLDEYYRGV
jgi:hypothetical protein